MLIALTDIAEGDGGTMLIPASHKSNLNHPGAEQLRPGGANSIAEVLKRGEGLAVDGHPGAIEVFMKAGDALLFSGAQAPLLFCSTSPDRCEFCAQMPSLTARRGESMMGSAESA